MPLCPSCFNDPEAKLVEYIKVILIYQTTLARKPKVKILTPTYIPTYLSTDLQATFGLPTRYR